MRLETVWLPGGLAGRSLASSTVVVIDVLRAATTIVEALARGAGEIVPVVSVKAAREFGRSGRGRSMLLCGERGGGKIPGFDLGNSPLEYTAERVAGKRLVLTTTNATRAIGLASRARTVLLAALTNAGAVARRLRAERRDVLLVNCGGEGRFSLEDAICAGLIAERLRTAVGVEESDATRAARFIYRAAKGKLYRTLCETEWGRELVRLGCRADIAFSARVDTRSLVPALVHGRIVRLE